MFSLPLCSSHTKKHCWAPLMTKTERVGSSIPWYLYPQPNYGPSNLRSGSLFFNLSAAYSYLNDTWCIKLVIRKILFFLCYEQICNSVSYFLPLLVLVDEVRLCTDIVVISVSCLCYFAYTEWPCLS